MPPAKPLRPEGVEHSAPAALALQVAAPLIVALLTLLTFLPILKNEFVWDDYPLIIDNAFVQRLDAKSLHWMWTRADTGHYHPLSYMLLAGIRQAAGPNPQVFHAVSLILHTLNALLVYMISLSLIGTAWGTRSNKPTATLLMAASISALIFAVHPQRAETVAWVIAIRDLLCAHFYLLTIMFYLKACQSPRRRSMWFAAIISHAIALLCKPMAVSLPIVLLILDVYPLQRLTGRPKTWLRPPQRTILWEKAAFVLLSIAAAAIAPIAEIRAGALSSLEGFGITERITQMMYGLAFYLFKMVVPVGLSPLYELPNPFNPAAGQFLLCDVAVIVLTVLFLGLRRRLPAGTAAWACYVIILLPVLGLVHIGPFIAADRYTYFSAIPWAVLIAGTVVRLARRRWEQDGRPHEVGAAASMGVMLLAVLSILSWNQCRVWHNAESLWMHARNVDPSSRSAQGNLASALADANQPDRAWWLFQQMLNKVPGYPPAVHGLAYVQANRGRHREAVALYEMALTAMPTSAELHADLAQSLAALGRHPEAAEHYRQALKIWPAHLRAQQALETLETR